MRPPRSSSPTKDTEASTTAADSGDATLAGTLAASRPQERPPAELGRGDQVGRYLLLDVLGQGAMGRVFQAYDPDLDRKVAIKILFDRTTADPAQRDRLLQEAKAMARIDHRNVVTVHDAGVHEDAVFLAMELVDGPSLDRWLKDSPSKEQIWDVMLQAARGLAGAHAAGVVHRDFKPGNVLVTRDGRAKVGDFGIAGIDDAAEGGEGKTISARRALGTPGYMSPEHVSGSGIDTRSDQFSFAVTLYESLYAERPFTGTTWPELAAKLLSGDVDPKVATRRGRLDDVIRRAMSVDPEQRYPSMDALIEEVERIRKPKRRWWVAAGVAGLGVAALAYGGRSTPTAGRCGLGAERIAVWWNEGSKGDLEVSSPSFTERHASQTRERFEREVDDYASEWSAAFDASCARVGPTSREGTVAQRHTAECLENRYDSLRGLVEFVASAPVGPSQVNALVGTLPRLEDCEDDRWVPYPADPKDAARAAKLHQDIAAIRRRRLADRSENLLETSGDVVQEARDLNEPYLLARALGEQARLLSIRGEHEPAEATIAEALEVALAAEHDQLAAHLINAMMLSLGGRPGTREVAAAFVTVARGLLDGGRRNPTQMGNILLNHARILRKAEDYEAALAADTEAAEQFAMANDTEGVEKARVNKTATLASQGKFAEARALLDEAGPALVRSEGETSPNAFVVRGMQTKLVLRSKRPQDALPMAARAHALAKDIYTPGSSTLWNATDTYLTAALIIGNDALGRRLLDELGRLDPPNKQAAVDRAIYELVALENLERWQEVLEGIPYARRRATADGFPYHVLRVELIFARTLLMLGRYDELRKHMSGSALSSEIGEQGMGLANGEIALMGTLLGVAPPGRTTWSDLARRRPLPPQGELLFEVVDALESGVGAAPAMKTARDKYVAIYHEHDPLVQMLEHGLEHAERIKGPSLNHKHDVGAAP